jgi:uncharacterized membrane protein
VNTFPLKAKPLTITLFVMCALLHLLIVVFNHYQFRTFAYYYGVYNFAFYDFAHLQNSPNTVLFDGTGATFLQDHFSLLLPLLSPLYWILTPIMGTYTLLILQWVAIVYGGFATYKLIASRSSKSFLPLAAMLCYFFLYSRLVSYNADCNLAIIGSSLIPVFLYYFERLSKIPLFIIFAVLLITREDFSLWLIFICIYLLIENRKDRQKRNRAIVFMIISLFYFALTMAVFIPALETPNAKFMLFNYGALGQNSFDSLKFIASHPLKSIQWLFSNHQDDPSRDGLKLPYYIVFGLSGGILLFLRPATLICLIPVVAKKMYNDDPERWGIESYYGIETASILPALIFITIAAFANSRWVAVLGAAVLTATLITTVWCMEHAPGWFADTKLRFYKGKYWQPEVPVKEYRDALKLIPPKAAVSASGKFVSQLAYRQKIYYFPLVNDAEYVCATVSGEPWPKTREEYNGEIDRLRRSNEWKVIFEKDDLVIFKHLVH